MRQKKSFVFNPSLEDNFQLASFVLVESTILVQYILSGQSTSIDRGAKVQCHLGYSQFLVCEHEGLLPGPRCGNNFMEVLWDVLGYHGL